MLLCAGIVVVSGIRIASQLWGDNISDECKQVLFKG